MKTFATLAVIWALSNEFAFAAGGEPDLARARLSFEPRAGRAERDFDFVARGPRYGVGLRSDGATIRAGAASVDMHFVGARVDAPSRGEERAHGTTSYFLGTDPAHWRRDVPTWSRVRFCEAWPGVDVVFHGCGGALEYDFEIRPGVDPSTIRVAFDGLRDARIADDGALVLVTDQGAMRQPAPVVLQGECEVAARWRLSDDGTAAVEIDGYDASQGLLVDPVVEWTALVGGGNDDVARAIEMDSLGNYVIAGHTASAAFPSLGGAFGSKGAGIDAFVMVLDSSGYEHLYTAFLGGQGADYAYALALDRQNDQLVYLAGTTFSVDFPLASLQGHQPFQSNRLGGSDAFLLKLDLDLDQLVYSTYFGGTGEEDGYGLAVDFFSQPCLVGQTFSSDLPMVDALQPDFGGSVDGFAAKLNTNGDALVWSTYVGGSGTDRLNAVAIDDVDNHYLAGGMSVGDPGFEQILVQHVQPDGTYGVQKLIGGSASEEAQAIAVDEYGVVYVGGWTNSSDLPLAHATQSVHGGNRDAFFGRLYAFVLDPTFLTFFGGSGDDDVRGLDVVGGEAWVVGTTDSDDLPTFDAVSNRLGGSHDGFVARYHADFDDEDLIYATYFPGGDEERLHGVVHDGARAVVVGQVRAESSAPDVLATVTHGTLGGSFDVSALVAKIDRDALPAIGVAEFAISQDQATDGEVFEFFVHRHDGNLYPGPVNYQFVQNGASVPGFAGQLYFQYGEQFTSGGIDLGPGGVPSGDFELRLVQGPDGPAIGANDVLQVDVGQPTGGGGGGGYSSSGDDSCPFNAVGRSTSLEPGLEDLRGFRDEWLAPHPLGRDLVRAYYAAGPRMVRFLREHPALVPLARGLTAVAIVFARHPLAFLLAAAIACALMRAKVRTSAARALSQASESARMLRSTWPSARSTPCSSTSTAR